MPGSDGRFSAALPADRTYRVQPYAFGLPAGPPTSFVVGREAVVDIGDITLTASAHLTATVVDGSGTERAGPEDVRRAGAGPRRPAAGSVAPSFYGLFPGCNPMLGPPHGGSPACNRAVTSDGQFDLLIPPGHYYVYATRGPFATLDRGADRRRAPAANRI